MHEAGARTVRSGVRIKTASHWTAARRVMVGCVGRPRYPLCRLSRHSLLFTARRSSHVFVPGIPSLPPPPPPLTSLKATWHTPTALSIRCTILDAWVLCWCFYSLPLLPLPPPPHPRILLLCTPAISCPRPTVSGASIFVHGPVLPYLLLTRAFSLPLTFYEQCSVSAVRTKF